MLEKKNFKVPYSYVYIFYLVASWACEVIIDCNRHQKSFPGAYLCEDVISPTSDQYINLFLLYMTLFRNYFFTHASSYRLILHLYYDIKLGLLLL